MILDGGEFLVLTFGSVISAEELAVCGLNGAQLGEKACGVKYALYVVALISAENI